MQDERLLPEKSKLSIDEAVAVIRAHIPEAQTAQRQMMMMIWRWGGAVAAIDKPWGRKMDIYNELHEKTGIHFNLLRQYEALFDQFLGKQASFERFLDYFEKTNTLRVNFTNVSNVLKLLDRVEPEFREDIVARQVESAVRRVAEINADNEEAKVKRETAEAISQILEVEYEELKELVESGEKIFTDNTPRSEPYLNFVRDHRCILSPTCDCSIKTNDCHAHHTEEGGKSIKGSDFSAIPLCPASHDFWHQHGREAFEERYDVETPTLVADMLHRRMTLQPLYVHFDIMKDGD